MKRRQSGGQGQGRKEGSCGGRISRGKRTGKENRRKGGVEEEVGKGEKRERKG